MKVLLSYCSNLLVSFFLIQKNTNFLHFIDVFIAKLIFICSMILCPLWMFMLANIYLKNASEVSTNLNEIICLKNYCKTFFFLFLRFFEKQNLYTGHSWSTIFELCWSHRVSWTSMVFKFPFDWYIFQIFEISLKELLY